MQNIIDFTGAEAVFGKLTRKYGAGVDGERVFYGRALCRMSRAAGLHGPADARLEGGASKPELINDRPMPPTAIKTFTQRGSRILPYMHDGRLMTLEDTVEYFNLVLSLRLGEQDKAALVAYMRQL
jgi:cytochrome c peroxidase